MKLLAKYFIKGQIKAMTGLHIGGSKTALDIGGIDSNVIKNAQGQPYIPGSSLKGKLRSMLVKGNGTEELKDDVKAIRELFGFPPKQKNSNNEEVEPEISRLIVRDSMLNDDIAEKMRNQEDEFQELELDYTEGKWENTIDRKTGTAAGAGPRQIERVPAGAIFDFELIYNVYDDGKKDEHLAEIKKAMRLLEDDYLGGSGSRGYGKIKFIEIKEGERTIEQYKKNEIVKFDNVEL